MPDTLLPAALYNLVDPDAASIYLKQRWDIDWDLVIARRVRILKHEPELTAYLVLPEIAWLLDHALHANTHLMLDTLWHTGARVSEMLALTRSSFHLDVARNDCFVSLHTLKAPRRGRPKKQSRNTMPRRMVPLFDDLYIERVRRYFSTFSPGPNDRLFAFTRQTANNRIKRIALEIPELPFTPSAHTLRHSFAVNAVMHGAPIRVLQQWLGHANIASTEIYTKVLASETAHFMAAIRYSVSIR